MKRSFKPRVKTGGPYRARGDWSRERKNLIDFIEKFVKSSDPDDILRCSISQKAKRLTNKVISHTQDPHFPRRFSFSKLRRVESLIDQIKRIEYGRELKLHLLEKRQRELNERGEGRQAVFKNDDVSNDGVDDDDDETPDLSDSDSIGIECSEREFLDDIDFMEIP